LSNDAVLGYIIRQRELGFDYQRVSMVRDDTDKPGQRTI
jgi:hypothetical protein